MPNKILPLLVSLAGFLFGLILSFISPEELKPGKKYFILLKKLLFSLLFLFSLFIPFYFKTYFLVFLPLSYLLLYFLIIKKQKPLFKELFNYSFFILVYFLAVDQKEFIFLFSSLIFLYGLPTCTLLRLNSLEQQEAKYSKLEEDKKGSETAF